MFGIIRKKTLEKLINEEIENFKEFNNPVNAEFYKGAIWGMEHFKWWQLDMNIKGLEALEKEFRGK